MDHPLKRKRSVESSHDEEQYIAERRLRTERPADYELDSPKHAEKSDAESEMGVALPSMVSVPENLRDDSVSMSSQMSRGGVIPLQRNRPRNPLRSLTLGDMSNDEENFLSSQDDVDDDDDDGDDEADGDDSIVAISSTDSETTTSSSSSSSGSDSDSVDVDDESVEGEESANADPDDEAVVQISFKRPTITASTSSELLSRISSFLPQLRNANQELEQAPNLLDHQIENVDDNESHYVEMNLGLGVLKESKAAVHDQVRLEPSSSSSSGSSSSSSSSDESDRDGHGATDDRVGVLAKLMGSKRNATQKPVIEEVSKE